MISSEVLVSWADRALLVAVCVCVGGGGAQVEAAAYTVHAPIYTSSMKELEREGDQKLRGFFHEKMTEMLAKSGFKVRQTPHRMSQSDAPTGISGVGLD